MASLGPSRVRVTCQAWPPWRVAQCVTDTGAWWRLLGGVHMSPTGVGSAVMCASSSFRRSAGTGLHCCPPAACVVSCTPCRVVQQCCAPLGVPGGVPPVRGAPWLYGCNWQACGYTLAGLPLERSVAHSPRCAALQRCCALPQLRAGTSSGFFGVPGGTLVATVDGGSRVGIATWWWLLAACALLGKKGYRTYTG